MLSSRDLDRLKARTQALRQSVGSPFITMNVWREGEEPPERKPWQLTVMIESPIHGGP